MLTIGRRTLMGNPRRLLLLDEPSGGYLAPLVVQTLLEKTRELKAQGLTILLAEQGVDFSLALASTGSMCWRKAPSATAVRPLSCGGRRGAARQAARAVGFALGGDRWIGPASSRAGSETRCRFGSCYIPDYHPEQSGSWQAWYDNMIAEVKLAEALGFDGAWFCRTSCCRLCIWLATATVVHRRLAPARPSASGLVAQ